MEKMTKEDLDKIINDPRTSITDLAYSWFVFMLNEKSKMNNEDE